MEDRKIELISALRKLKHKNNKEFKITRYQQYSVSMLKIECATEFFNTKWGHAQIDVTQKIQTYNLIFKK